MVNPAFSCTERLLGGPALQRLHDSHVAVFGIGGVGRFTFIDADKVCESNLNRQLVALRSTIGRLKVDVMADRVRDINPAAEVTTHPVFYSRATADAIDLRAFDFIADAIDSVDAKVELIMRARQEGVPIISCMGAGNKRDPTRFEVAPLSATSVCPLCKVMRRRLKAQGNEDVRVVYSREPPRHLHPPGSLVPVTATAGLVLAAEIIQVLSR